MKTEYIVAGDGWEYPNDAEEFETVFDIDDPEWMAFDAGRHFSEKNDGHEEWPIFFELYQDGVSIGVFEVDLEMSNIPFCGINIKIEVV